MANLTIRNIDDEVVNRLKQRARAHERSLEAELRAILTRAAEGHSPADLRALAERIAAMTPEVPQSDSAELLRAERAR